MKSIGIVRKVDELGRIVIPMELRKTMDIQEKDGLEIFVDGDLIILKKYNPGCIICGDMRDMVEVGKINLCRKHAIMIKEELGKSEKYSFMAGK